MRPAVVCGVEKAGTHFAGWLTSQLVGHTAAWACPVARGEFKKPNVGVLVTHVYAEGYQSHSAAIVGAIVGALVEAPLAGR